MGGVKGDPGSDDSLARVNSYIKYRGNNTDSGARVNVNPLLPSHIDSTSLVNIARFMFTKVRESSTCPLTLLKESS